MSTIAWSLGKSLALLLASAAAVAQCGTERWPVKTLNDPSVHEIHFTAVESTVHTLRVPKQPPNLRTLNPYLRLDGEKQVYTVKALLIGFKREADGDYHLVLADPVDRKKTMIAEIPASKCANKKYAAQFDAAAKFVEQVGHTTAKFKTLDKPVPVTVTGVFFFDFIHGQDGVAPNGAELHPVLEIKAQNQTEAQLQRDYYGKPWLDAPKGWKWICADFAIPSNRCFIQPVEIKQ
jgi:hypothetical protein